jgi:SAM-dependent methyltransferase
MPSGNFRQIEPQPPLWASDETFDLIYAHSVFSHLPEKLASEWVEEFARLLAPGGLALLTTRKREFIINCKRFRLKPFLHGVFADTDRWLETYDRGEFCFESSETLFEPEVAARYGEACIPESYVRREWSGLFEIVDYVDESLDQSIIVLRKVGGTGD